MIGSAGGDTVNAVKLSAGNSVTVLAGAGLDRLIGGAGGDTFNFRSADLLGDTVRGGGGFDSLNLTTRGTLDTSALAKVSGIDQINVAAGGNGLTLTDANFAGTAAPAQIGIKGSAGRSSIDGADLTGSHAIRFFDGGGTDTVLGGAGDDEVRYVGGALAAAGDVFDGGDGTGDKILFDRSMNFLGAGITNLESLLRTFGDADAVDVRVSGTIASNLTQLGSTAFDQLTTVFTVELADGSITSLSGLRLAKGDAGDAINVVSQGGTIGSGVNLSADIARFTGGSASDTVSFGGGPDGAYKNDVVIDLGGGDDFVQLDKSSAATIMGGSGTDTLFLSGAAFINLEATSDQRPDDPGVITGFENVRAEIATAGVTIGGRNDVSSLLIGSNFADTIFAGAGGATINGGLGGDTLVGDTNRDFFEFYSAGDAAGDTIDGGDNFDKISLRVSLDLRQSTISNIEELELVNSASGPDAALFASVTSTQAEALSSVRVSGSLNSIEFLTVSASASTVDLSNLEFFNWGAGDQVEILTTTAPLQVIGSKVNDRISSAATIDGGAGDDVIGYTIGLGERLDGGSGNDTLKLEQNNGGVNQLTVRLDFQSVVEFLDGGGTRPFESLNFENADFGRSSVRTNLVGTDDANVLKGGTAADKLVGGLGADTLTGGSGADTFVWNSKDEGGDTVTDFQSGTDKLSFDSTAFTVAGAVYDVAKRDAPGLSLDDVDVLVANQPSNQRLNNADQVRDYITSKASADHGMFVIAENSQGHAVLYYSSHIGVPDASGKDFAFYQIADLGAVLPGSVSGDLVFI